MGKKFKKRVIVIVVVSVILLGFVFQDSLLRTYVRLFHRDLEAYSRALLEEVAADETGTWPLEQHHYGLWRVFCFPDVGMVQFDTWSFGIAPSSHHKGFYYAADNKHKGFDGSRIPLEANGDKAQWEFQGNQGTSTQICNNWFWYTADF